MIAAAQFREDLFYRLAEIVVKIPSLAERPGDAALLAKVFLGRFAREMNPVPPAAPQPAAATGPGAARPGQPGVSQRQPATRAVVRSPEPPPAGQGLRLEPGMVFTVEPGLYIPLGTPGVPEKYQGIGIRIEDDVLMSSNGAHVLTDAAPKTVDGIEQLMA